MSKQTTQVDPFEGLDDAVERVALLPPEDAFTKVQFAARYKLTVMVATCRLQRLVADGAVECLGQFGPRRAWHYRVRRQG
jgi:hypothetical protein